MVDDPRSWPRTLVFAATYNEIGNIDDLLQRIWATDPRFHVLIVDDHSPDGTGQYLEDLAAVDRRLRVVHRPGKLGLGTAHQLAMLYAVQMAYDRLVTMDADLSHDPADIPRLLSALDEADFVIGSRYAKGGSSDYVGWRKFLSVSANTLARSSLGVPVHEFTTSFRAFRVSALRDRRCAKLRGGGYSYFMETVFRLHRAGFRVREVPISFRDRVAGVSKIPKYEIVNGASKLLRLAVSRVTGGASNAAPNIMANCSGCSSTFLMEYYPPSTGGSAPGVEAYRCSTMDHHRRPQIARCLQCGLMQVPEAHRPTDLIGRYVDVEDPLYLENVSARESTFEDLFRRLAPTLGAPGRLLEVGAYCGLFLAVAQRHGWVVEGVEPSRWAAQVATSGHGLRVYQGTLQERWSDLTPPYRVLVAWDVLEHLERPFDLLLQANQLLEEGGIFAFSTLDVENWFARVAGGAWPWWMDMHLYYFNQALLRRWLERAGFDVVEISRYRHFASPSYLAQKAANLMPRGSGAFFRASRHLSTEWSVPVSMGDIVLVVARKREECRLPLGSTAEALSP